MKFKPYPKYKPSGIEIPFEIPIDWEIKRGRFVMEVNPSTKPSADAVTDDFTFVPMELIGEKGELNLSLTKAVDEIGTGYTPFKNNDVIVAKITPCFENGKAALVQGVKSTIAYGTTELHVLRARKNTSPRFLFYVATSHLFRELGEAEMYGAGGQKRVPPDFCKNFRFALPSLQEQISIARFLDQETKRVDHLIEKKKQLIERLKEKRAALISHTVTKGLPPQAARAAGLPVNPKMKPSGVDWLGDVPAHWEIKPLKRIGKAILGLTYSPEDVVANETEGILVFRASNLQSGQIVYDDNVYVDTEVPTEIKTIVGDILLCSRSGSQDLIGKNAIVSQKDAEKTFGAFMTVFRSKLNNYVYYVLNSTLFERQKGQYQTTTINQLTSETLNGFKIPIPPTKERQEIVALLKNETQRIDNLTTKVVMVIERLSESRSALIQAAVSGKINVQGA